MVGNRVGAIIQVRYDSERLPGKALLKLPFGGEFSILEHICRRLKTANGVDEIIVATSNEKSDDAIAEEAKKIGINCFRGDKANVLDRFYKAAVSSKLQTAIRLTGDNPVIFTELFQPVISYHLDNHNELPKESICRFDRRKSRSRICIEKIWFR
jgi:spore coat polysaccharide biosynthesis protein SpsF